MVSKIMFLLLLYYLVVFAGSGAGCRNLFSGLIFASSIESLKSAHTSKFTSFCKSVELASEVLYTPPMHKVGHIAWGLPGPISELNSSV